MGDFWETEERRAISTFTTAIGTDSFILLTNAQTLAAQQMFNFIPSFQVGRCACPPLRPRASPPPDPTNPCFIAPRCPPPCLAAPLRL